MLKNVAWLRHLIMFVLSKVRCSIYLEKEIISISQYWTFRKSKLSATNKADFEYKKFVLEQLVFYEGT